MSQAIGYCRVSTKDKDQDWKIQQDAIQSFCTMKGLTLLNVKYEEVSGGKADNRPKLQEAIDIACKTKGILVVYSLSRFARDVSDAIALTKKLRKAGAQLVSLTENIDTTTAIGDFFFNIMASLAQFERKLISERVQNGMDYHKKLGRRVSQCVYGFDMTPDGSRKDGSTLYKLVENATEQAVIVRIMSMKAEGKSLREISGTLNSEGIKSKTGGKWYASSVREVAMRQEAQEVA